MGLITDYFARKRAAGSAEQIGGLMGQRGWEQAGPMQPDMAREQIGGTGLIGGKLSPTEFYGEMAQVPGYESAGTTGLQASLAAQTKAGAQGAGGPFSGTGMDAQTYNTIIGYQQKIQAKQPTTREEDMAYSLASQRATRPQRYTTPEGRMYEVPGISLEGITAPTAAPQPGLIGAPARPEPKQVGERKFTEGQNLAAGYADRMKRASQTAGALTEGGYDPSNLQDQAARRMGAPGNYMMTGQGQQYTQAQEDWVRAKLRKESGAVIGDEEMSREITTYFPQAGDQPAVVAQKKRARETAERAMIKQSAGAYTAPTPPPGFE